MPYKSSFHGGIAEIPDIYVDNFENINKKAYFLSHCHTDHTHGLYSRSLITSMKKNGAKIYMTEESMKIVRHTARKNRISNMCDFIQPLKFGTSTVTIEDKQHIEVTLIPAGHCFGSVMFLFRIKNKTILYTGDFRIRINDIPKYTQFHKKGEPITIDVMYVDTTFINMDYQEFAKRSISVEETVGKIDSWLKEDQFNRVAIHTSATYGYEYVFSEIYKRLGVKVCVNDDAWELYQQFPKILQVLTTGKPDPQIHLCKMIRYSHKCYHNSIRGNRYLSIHFSALSWKNYVEEQKALKEDATDVKVCFATHCSRGEVMSFVNYFQPAKVVGFPDPYVVESPENVFDDEFIPTPKKRSLVMEPRDTKARNLWGKLV